MTRQEITTFYNKHYKRLYNSSYRIVGNSSDAEEIMHDTILKFLNVDSSGMSEEQISAWLLKSCIRMSIDKVRSLKRKEDFEEEYKADSAILSVAVGESQDRASLIKRVKQALMKIKNPYRTVLSLLLVEGYDYQEIAQITMQGESTVRSQFSRGKAMLAQLIKGQNN